MGTLGDRIGRRKLLRIGAAAFGVASVLAAFSTTAAMLIAARAARRPRGDPGAVDPALIRNMFLDPAQRTVAISIWITRYSAGAAIGPLIGGVLLEHFWRGSVFLINVPMMLLLVALGPVLLPEFRDPDAGRLDPVSAVRSLAAVLAVIYGLKRIAESGPGWIAALSILAGVAVVGMILIGTGLAVASMAHSLAEVYVAYGLGVGLGVGCSYVPSLGTVQRWFVRRRGFASGLAVSGIGVGTVVMPPLAALLIEVQG